MPRRTYDQYCPIAVALDLLGDRWTLLIVRELLLAPRRYSDLDRALVGASPNLLADRLRELEAAGLVAREELPPPAARTVYTLTEDGRRAREVIEALARFGLPHLPDPGEREVRPAMAVYAALAPFFDPSEAGGVDDHYRLVLAGRTFDLAVRGGRLVIGPEGEPDLVVELDPGTLVAARQGRADLRAQAAAGELRVDGEPAALDRFLRCFSLAGGVAAGA